MDFSQRAAEWDDDPQRVSRSRSIADAITAAVDLRERPSAIELGAGTGLLSRQLCDRLGPVTLTDCSPGMVEIAKARIVEHELTGWEAVLVSEDPGLLPRGPYGLALSQLALHHMGDPSAVFTAVYDRLLPGGHLAICDLDHDPDGAFHRDVDDFDGPHGFHRSDIEGWLSAVGFVEVTVGSATTITREVDGETRDFTLFLATGRRP